MNSIEFEDYISENEEEIDIMNVDDVRTSLETSRDDMASDAATLQISSTENYFTHYKMDHPKRGIAIIFNQIFPDLDVVTRTTGTNVCCSELINTLHGPGFDIWNCQNFMYANLIEAVKRVAKLDHFENDCLIVIMLSYGFSDYVSASDIYYKTDVLFNRFSIQKCPTLAGKP
ncbi:caspase-1-like [Nylanderia fulva]|uniref:caspase-1-like n=1 Tax=Nylanderia fulva TaxID=613905 RepID=UPI0010FB5A1C|nr:caspase-1-like [Nylanderia fulva]XP_029176402.1 caspase-1-like [Nylanderia fulva]